MKILFAVLLIVHGLIVAGQSSGSFHPVGGVKNPSWLAWWPGNLGQSWLFSTLGVERSPVVRAGGVIWLAAGAALVAAGLGVLGFVVPSSGWRSFALAGGALSLVMLAVYLHPLYVAGIGSSIALVAALLSDGWPLLERLGL